MKRTSRNYYSPKLIPSIPVKVRRIPSYLRRIFFKRMDIYNLKNNDEFFKNKYMVGQDIFFDKAPLPDVYYTNEIKLIPKNKNTIFSYWEIKDDTYNYMKENFDVFSNAVIYLYKNDTMFRKISNLPRFGSYYILNVESDKEYRAIIGFENKYGDFFEIAQSKELIVPSGKISNNIQTIWGIQKFIDKKIELNEFSKDNLPEETYLLQEILDKELVYNLSKKEILEYHGASENSIKIIEESKIGMGSSKI